jgi:alpha-1,3-rhamnosyl/mannosyltransferase
MKFTLFLKTMLRLSARIADRILVVSEFTGRELQTLLQVPPERIRVIHNGPSSSFRELDPAERERELGRRPQIAALPRPFLLSAGHHLARKNFVRLVQAHEALANRGHLHHLVIVGPEGPATRPLEAAIRDSRHGSRVHRLDRLPDDDLCLLFNLAEAIVYPSIYEGFGLPVLEAFDAGVPLVASNLSSIPEVAGDAALLVDARSVPELAGALEAVLTRPELRRDLIARGRTRRQAFSWTTAAEKTAAALLELGAPPSRQGASWATALSTRTHDQA